MPIGEYISVLSDYVVNYRTNEIDNHLQKILQEWILQNIDKEILKKWVNENDK